MNIYIWILALVIALPLQGCERERLSNNDNEALCSNLRLRIAKVFPGEDIKVIYKDSTVFSHAITTADSRNDYRIRKDFCIPKPLAGKLRLSISGAQMANLAIDTIFNISTSPYPYVIIVGYPIPKGLNSMKDLHVTFPIK